MGSNTKIAWTWTPLPGGGWDRGATFNPWIGCTKVSAGCANCFAEAMMDTMHGRVHWGRGQDRSKTNDRYWKKPIAWDAEAKRIGVRRKVFCASLADVFDDEVNPAWRDELYDLIKLTPNLDWLLLTKRIGNVQSMLIDNPKGIRSVWVGTSIENDSVSEYRLKELSQLPVAVRFVSAEPLLGRFDLGDNQIDWMIVGGESGPNHRIMSLDDARYMRDQCRERNIPFFFKQVGGRYPSSGGDLLDGESIKEYPNE